jgi:hypothetical protein
MRQAAELRRQRILDNANKRMGLVEGRVVVATTAPLLNRNDGSVATEQPSTESATTSSDMATTATTTGSSSSSTSAKLAAMRKRRFRTTAGTATTTAAAASSGGDHASAASTIVELAVTATSAIPENTPTGVDETTTPTKTFAPAVVDDENHTPAANIASSSRTTTTQGATEVAEESVETKSSSTTTTSASTKYLGVAKMRRRMLQQNKSAATASMSTTTTTTVMDESSALESFKKPVKKPSLYHSTVPIYMHIATVVLLFAAGLDVGLQQRTVDYVLDKKAVTIRGTTEPSFFLTVHSELAPRKMGGTQRLLSLVLPFVTDNNNNNNNLDNVHTVKPSIAQPFDWASQSSLDSGDELVDEFDVTTNFNDDAAAAAATSTFTTNHKNIDPLFQVDLDQYTQGNGPFWSVARGAVRLHRLNLAIFYYAPRSLFRALADFVWSLWQSPPVLCITAIVLRQFVGKFLLGAHLPTTTKANEAQQKDVLTMVKNFVSNVVLSSFPTAVTLYDVWTHLRADMYVLLCGFLVGLAWSHNGRAGSMYGTGLETDTLAAIGRSDDAVSDESVAGPILDSLGEEL